MNRMFIIVKNQFEGIHCYPKAPRGVEFLRNQHRHMFYIETEIEVFDDDRELEFIMVQRRINKFFESYKELKNMSCEMIAKELQSHIKEWYPIPYNAQKLVQYVAENCSSQYRTKRYVNVKVLEDNENGAYLREV